MYSTMSDKENLPSRWGLLPPSLGLLPLHGAEPSSPSAHTQMPAPHPSTPGDLTLLWFIGFLTTLNCECVSLPHTLAFEVLDLFKVRVLFSAQKNVKQLGALHG